MGAAQAAGTIGSANALANAFGQGTNLYLQGQQNQFMQNLMNRLYPNTFSSVNSTVEY
jgi:Pyruvate/2-oxoacid:ferredoxin oxidoreductase gamma subunit